MPNYAGIKSKKNELIRKATDGSVFVAPYAASAITTLTSGTTTNEIQTITITGTPTGGTFTLSFNGPVTAPIAHNALATAVQTALEGIASIDPGDITVTGSAGGPYTVTFIGRYGATDVSAIVPAGSFTGGTSPAIAVTTPTPGTGVSLTALPSGYEDLGYITTDGASFGRETSVSDVNSFGSVEPTRSDVTSDVITLQVTAQETRLSTIGLYTGADLSGTLAALATGEFQVAKPARPGFRYYRVLGLFVDPTDFGEIYLARFMPRARVTEFSEQAFTNNDEAVGYGVTFTGYEDSSLGYSHKWIFGGAGWNYLLSSMGIPRASA